MKFKLKILITIALVLLLNLGISTITNAQSLVPDAVITKSFDCACGLVGKNLLSNPSFETVGSSGSPVIFTGVSSGNSAAANWTVFNNLNGTIKTELENSIFPNGGAKMIHVITNTQRSGLVQVFLPFNTGAKKTIASAWVFVRKGKVGIGTGNGGNTGLDSTNLTTNTWERLQAPNGVSPANEFIIYSQSDSADFYVDSTCVTALLETE